MFKLRKSTTTCFIHDVICCAFVSCIPSDGLFFSVFLGSGFCPGESLFVLGIFSIFPMIYCWGKKQNVKNLFFFPDKPLSSRVHQTEQSFWWCDHVMSWIFLFLRLACRCLWCFCTTSYTFSVESRQIFFILQRLRPWVWVSQLHKRKTRITALRSSASTSQSSCNLHPCLSR